MNISRRLVFQHAVKPGASGEQASADATLRFSVQQCADPLVPEDGMIATRPSLRKQQRKAQRQKSQRPRDWRTRKDPFEGCWEQVTSWLIANPARTGVSIFQALQQRYPDRWRLTQCRTLQRGLPKVRRSLLVTFEEQWAQEEPGEALPAPILRAEVVAAPF